MTNRNRLISSDNKGYAAYFWERQVERLDYLTDLDSPRFVGGFAQTNAQTNAGDMSPDLNLRPGSGPTEDEFENTRIIGTRQYDAASALAAADGMEITGPIASRAVTVDLSQVTVEPRFTGDGRTHRTSGPAGGSASFAGATVDGPAFPGFAEGRNPWWDWPSRIAYRWSGRLRDSQAPKGIVLPGAIINKMLPVVAERVPVQLLRIGPLHLIGIPGEVTLHDGSLVPLGPPTVDLSHRYGSRRRRAAPDTPPSGLSFGEVVAAPRAAYGPGQRVTVTFVGGHPGNDLHRGGTFLEVQRGDGPDWETMADDGDWATRFLWKRVGRSASEVTILWDIPQGTRPGSYRIRYSGEALDAAGALDPVTGISPTFEVGPSPRGRPPVRGTQPP
jgi:hypothetical protein